MPNGRLRCGAQAPGPPPAVLDKRASRRQRFCCPLRREALKKALAAVTVLAATTINAPTVSADVGGFTPWWQAPHPKLVHELRTDIRLRRDHAVKRAWKLGIILHPHRRERLTVDIPTLEAMDARWHLRAHGYRLELRRRAPVYAALACIHSYEGSWWAYSPAGPYYGGYQMDPSFERAYGADYLSIWGDASSWPVPMQTAAAYRATLAVGYTPWPNSAAACGL
jgi:hypothetical protein